ncbi:hypothetical protein UFOVP1329_38 [uncultured Caudovirales phage]|uniref:Uncharacterized protein n=1 Tax=uncultured Caudovirales phage TaxID=2100421 RepID=A0A6J5RTR7_9CAUD|nr:hypothetical protein UFOVP1150_19 [uncultured Caudovirales phage]CAB4199332.1 hypothetical protein UFOVP1329_38 [uncultured Caudovirales phage]CAB4218845.1 hypothetical protein UFOVP1595_42 [uncultured Caudovirales phage]
MDILGTYFKRTLPATGPAAQRIGCYYYRFADEHQLALLIKDIGDTDKIIKDLKDERDANIEDSSQQIEGCKLEIDDLQKENDELEDTVRKLRLEIEELKEGAKK